jgi:ABC-2 type transport system permease protein
MLAFPVENALGLIDRPRALTALGWQWGYVLAFGLASLGLWRLGLRRFAAYGG